MPLSSYVVPTREVDLGGGLHAVVRGLSVADITACADEHLGSMRKLFDRALQGDASTAEKLAETINDNIRYALRTFPDVVECLMARALVDEPDIKKALEVFRQLPSAAQFALVATVVDLTLSSEVVLGNALEAAAGVQEKLAAALVRWTSTDGSSVSAEMYPSQSPKATLPHGTT